MDLTSSPGNSSTEEVEEENSTLPGDAWDSKQSHDAGQTSPSGDGGIASSSQLPKIPLPMQKRRRVTRACDECRRKKIKCDGKQPCTHCTVYSYGWCHLSTSEGSLSKLMRRRQTVPTTNRQIADATLPLSISRRSSIDCSAPKRCSRQSSRMWIWMTPNLIGC